MDNYIIAIDLGSRFTSLVAGVYDEKELFGIRLLYMETTPSQGIKRGSVYNQELAAKVVNNLLMGAEKKLKKPASQTTRSYCANISGLNFRTEIRRQSVSIAGIPVTDVTLKNLLDDTKSKIYTNDNETIISVCPITYTIDNTIDTVSPVGQTGSKLEGVYLVTIALKSAIDNTNAAFGKSIKTNQVYPPASAKSVVLLTPEEKKSGTVLVDFGAATTNVAIFVKETLRHEVSIPIGSDTITNDIALGLNVSTHNAETLKQAFGLEPGAEPDKTINMTFPDNEKTSFQSAKLTYIIQARVEEILAYVDSEIVKSKCRGSVRSIVITGGGAKLKLLASFAEQKLGIPVHVSQTHYQVNDSDVQRFAGALGFASLFARENRDRFTEKQQSLFPETEETIQQPEKPAKPEPEKKQEKKKRNGFTDFWSKLLSEDEKFDDN